MSNKTPLPVFEVYFGGNVYPEKIPLNALSRTLGAVQRIALGETRSRDDEDSEQEDAIRLLGIKRGSARFLCYAPHAPQAVARLRLAGTILDDPEKADQAEYTFNPIEDLSAIARSLGCAISIRNPETKDVFATIGPDSFNRIAASMFIEGETTVAGRVERVGGATQNRCAMRVDFQPHLLYCQVATEDLARQIGQHLYEDIVADGTAHFLRTSWKIARFTVTSVYQPKNGSFLKTIKDLRAIGGDAWDEVEDPRKYIEEVTGRS